MADLAGVTLCGGSVCYCLAVDAAGSLKVDFLCEVEHPKLACSASRKLCNFEYHLADGSQCC